MDDDLFYPFLPEEYEPRCYSSIKQTCQSLHFSRIEKQKDDRKLSEQEIKQQYQINLIQFNSNVDYSTEFRTSLRITDGVICIVDCIEGVSVQTEIQLRESLLEGIKPVLFLNKIDRLWLEKHISLNDAYKCFKNTIDSMNVICQTYKNNAFGDIEMDPKLINVAFGSAYFRWSFTINDFAEMYHARFGLSKRKMIKKLWGNNYWYQSTNPYCRKKIYLNIIKYWFKLSYIPNDILYLMIEFIGPPFSRREWIKMEKSHKPLLNGFCQFILKPIHVLHDSIMNGESDTYLPIINALKLNITRQEIDKCMTSKDLLKLVMSRWLPIKKCVLGLCVDSLPSPKEAQKYKIPKLYTGALDTNEAKSMLTCDPNGTLSMYITKMIPIIKEPGRFIAFGRIFSGTIKRGQEVIILRQDDDDKIIKKKVQGIINCDKKFNRNLLECSAGNVCGLMGIDNYIIQTATICDSQKIEPFGVDRMKQHHVVQVAVNVVDPKHLKRLLDGLKKLSRHYQTVQINHNKQGQLIILGPNQLHLEVCLNELRETYVRNIKINSTNSSVVFRESINGISGSTPTLITIQKRLVNIYFNRYNKRNVVISTDIIDIINKYLTLSNYKGYRPIYGNIMSSKSSNKLTRIYASTEPLSTEICDAIESNNNAIRLTADMKAFGRRFSEKFPDWTAYQASKIWTFGCRSHGIGNVLVDQTKGCHYLDQVKSAIVQRFRDGTKHGVLCDEPLRGIKYNLLNAKILFDPSRRRDTQIMTAITRSLYAGQLSSTPTLMEPMYIVDIEVPVDGQNDVFTTLNKVSGEFIGMSDKTNIGIPLCTIKAYIPTIETLTNEEQNKIGFMQLLRENSKGMAFASMEFSHWKNVDGDPLIPGSLSNKLIMDVRKSKGMKLEIPHFIDYFDKR